MLAACLFSASATLADPGYISPWEEGYARSEPLQRRLSYVLENLVATSQSNAEVHQALNRVSLRTPTVSDNPSSPNAYASPGRNRSLVVMESRFANMIAAVASAGAYLAWTRSEEGMGRICTQLAADVQSSRARGGNPVFEAELEGFPETSNPVTMRMLERLQGMIADDAMIWFLLHEAGHVALNHGSTESLENSRRQEAAADHWASRSMQALGFGLFGPQSFLAGFGVIEVCLEELGYKVDESQSTHPLWTTRTLNMRNSFDVVHAGRGTPRSFVISRPDGDLWYHIAEPGSDLPSLASGVVPPIHVAPVWSGRSVNVYWRGPNGVRFVLRTADADLALLPLEQTTLDAEGRQIGEVARFTALQVNPNFLDWLEVSPGMRVGDVKKKSMDQYLGEAMTAANVELRSRGRVLRAFHAWQKGTNDSWAQYLTGAVEMEEGVRQLNQVDANLESELNASMNESQRAVFDQSIASHPFAGWSFGHDAAHYQRLERQLIDRSFREER